MIRYAATIAICFCAGYAFGFYRSVAIHGDWLIARTAGGATCTGTDIATGKNLGTWAPTPAKRN